ncbi:MAG: hypothetical protein HY907_01840 [Deltaproteobacteria bacterium]|nr:hypothetical protein [Deltaproteobacteria bacterium]
MGRVVGFRNGTRFVAVALAAVAITWPVRATAGVRASVSQTVMVDEDRLWVTEFLDLAPEGGESATLPSEARRYGAPAEAGEANKAGLRIGGGPMDEVELVDGALLLPETVPPEGISAALEYSIKAAGDMAGLTLRHPFPVADVSVSVTARVAGVRVSVAGAPPGATSREGPALWSASAQRTSPAAAGAPIRVVLSGLPAYHLPLWSKGALVLAFHLAGLALLNLARKRVTAMWRARKKPA